MLMLVIVTVAGGGGGVRFGLGSVDFAAGNMKPGTIRSDRASSGLAARCSTRYEEFVGVYEISTASRMERRVNFIFSIFLSGLPVIMSWRFGTTITKDF